MSRSPASRSELNFVLQQGFAAPERGACGIRYRALLFQPRVVAIVVVVGVVLQSPVVFGVLAAVLGWSALLPRWNPFDAGYNRTLALRPTNLPLTPAPAPRRFAQGLAAVTSLAITMSLASEWRAIAVALQAFLLLAVMALAFGRFCFGSFVYHLLAGRAAFAIRTLPWRGGGDRDWSGHGPARTRALPHQLNGRSIGMNDQGIAVGLKRTFALHAIVAGLVGMQHLVAPRVWTDLAGIAIAETVTWRLIGAALVALATSSWMAARATRWPSVRIVVLMEVVWSVLGAAVIAWGIVAEGLPPLEWINAVLLAGFALVFAAFWARAETAR